MARTVTTGSHYHYGGHVLAQGKRLRAAREKTGVNSTTAARLMGCSAQRLNALETGRTEAKARDVALYARLTGADVVDLLMGDERDIIEVPDEPASYRQPNGQDSRRSHREARERTQPRKAPRRAALPKTTVTRPSPPTPSQPVWRPANIGRDVRPTIEREQESTDAPT